MGRRPQHSTERIPEVSLPVSEFQSIFLTALVHLLGLEGHTQRWQVLAWCHTHGIHPSPHREQCRRQSVTCSQMPWVGEGGALIDTQPNCTVFCHNPLLLLKGCVTSSCSDSHAGNTHLDPATIRAGTHFAPSLSSVFPFGDSDLPLSPQLLAGACSR